ncbi:MAG: hypothetical protein HQL32_00855 [Planctomycetes bacterium]|nr:hypothetical protein [Planctomycetota bacterium]
MLRIPAILILLIWLPLWSKDNTIEFDIVGKKSAQLSSKTVQKEKESEPAKHISEQERLYSLAKRLENFGYYSSAEHYYKILARDDSTTKKMRETISNKLEILKQKKLKKRKEEHRLPDLDAIPHFNVSKSLLSSNVKNTESPIPPKEFASSRINKKKWIVSTLITVAVGYTAYRLHKHFTKPEPPVPNSITIKF